MSKNKLTTEIVQVTPAMAFTWLDKNTHNRHVSDAVVQRFAGMMKRGQWDLTHQGIAFSPEGVLVDGQHRLWAITEAGVTIPMMVTRGVEQSSMLGIDRNYGRTPIDSINLTYGSKLTKHHGAIANAMASGFNQGSKAKRSDVYLLHAFIEEHSAAIHATSEMFTPRKARICPAPVLGAVARAWYHVPKNRLKEFVNILLHGVMMGPEDSAAVLLRNFLLERQVGVDSATIVYAKAERAIQAFVSGEQLSSLRAVSEEQFLLKGESKPVPAPKPVSPLKGRTRTPDAVAKGLATKKNTQRILTGKAPIKIIKRAV